VHFNEFFRRATGGHEPYPYQQELAKATSLPELLDVPTGLGKTAAAVLGWLWRRRFADEAIRHFTPRRLVYCLPMRSLVEQTWNNCRMWRTNLGLSSEALAIHALMGGEDGGDWDGHPERNAILIGTQDMLLSRALNRGYGMSRYRWPVHFALVNNDCLWVLDETQLMGVGVTTSAQLQAFREACGVYGTAHTLWMSATLGHDQLATVDHPRPKNGWQPHTLTERDREIPAAKRLLSAEKPLGKSRVTLTGGNANKEGVAYAAELAAEIVDVHQPGTLTLVVVNRVDRARQLRQQLAKAEPDAELFLIHSRFRPMERGVIQATALDESTIDSKGPGRIVVATQAIEAGVDVSATTMIFELAPWSSCVQ
jgi:CRISPR-associated endonuclease/helicase Cas3